jgi:hypothetical protein
MHQRLSPLIGGPTCAAHCSHTNDRGPLSAVKIFGHKLDRCAMGRATSGVLPGVRVAAKRLARRHPLLGHNSLQQCCKPMPVVGFAGIRVTCGDQLRASRWRRLRDVVHVRRERQGIVVVDDRAEIAATAYAGTLYATTGPAFSAQPFDPSRVARTAVGSGPLSFNDANDGSIS